MEIPRVLSDLARCFDCGEVYDVSENPSGCPECGSDYWSPVEEEVDEEDPDFRDDPEGPDD